jgi:regulatory protein
MDSDWMERQALQYAARWESTRHMVAELLDRKIRQRCDRTGEDSEEALALIPGIVEGLAARDYVDDRRFATQTFDRLRRQGRSRAQIRIHLHRKGVPDSIVLELTRDDDPDAELKAAWRVARRRRLGPHCPDPERRAAHRERHLAILARQGFSRDIAYEVIDAEEASEPTRCT